MNTVNFDELGIEPPSTSFVGKKIEMEEILNLPIVVHDHKIVASKYPKNNPNCLHLQISIDDIKHVVFSASGSLMNMVERFPKGQSVATKIIKEKDSKRLIFTKA